MASNEARKKAAKKYQQSHPGTPYPEALRHVSHTKNAGPLGAVIGIDGEGRPVYLNLEEQVIGGAGPHCGITGHTGTGKSNLLAVMATSILESPPARGAQFVYSSDYPAPALDGCPHVTVVPADLDEYLTELVHSRSEMFRKIGAPGVRRLVDRGGADAPPAVVVMLDDFPRWGRDNPVPRSVLMTLRQGRTVDVHLVLTWFPGAPYMEFELGPHMTSRIDLSSYSRGLALWRRHDRSAPNGIAVTEFQVPLVSASSGLAAGRDEPPATASQR